MNSSPVLSPLVAQLYDLDAQIEALKAQRAALAAELIAQGEGLYIDDRERRGQVIIPTTYSTSYTLYPLPRFKAFLAEREEKNPTPTLVRLFRDEQLERAKKLGGDNFGALFDREVVFEPAAGFKDLVPKLLTPARARDLLLLTQVVKPPPDAHVKLPDKPKKSAAAESDDE